MHKQNVVGIVFRGPEGKKAIMQILRAKPHKPDPKLAERMKAFEEAASKEGFFKNAN